MNPEIVRVLFEMIILPAMMISMVFSMEMFDSTLMALYNFAKYRISIKVNGGIKIRFIDGSQ